MKETTILTKKKESKNRTAPYARKNVGVRFKDDTQTFGDELAELFITPKRNSKARRSLGEPTLPGPAYDGDIDMDRPQKTIKERRRSERLKALQCRTTPGTQEEEEPVGLCPPPTPIKTRRFRQVYNTQEDTQKYFTKIEAYKKRVTELQSHLLIQTTALNVSEERNRQLLKRVEYLEQQNVALTGNLRSLKASNDVPGLGISGVLRSTSPQSPETESSGSTPTDTPALPQRIIDEDYDEGMDLYHLRVARERVRQIYGIDDSMDADETLDQISNHLSENWRIDDESEPTNQARSGPKASSHNHLFSLIPVPPLY